MSPTSSPMAHSSGGMPFSIRNPAPNAQTRVGRGPVLPEGSLNDVPAAASVRCCPHRRPTPAPRSETRYPFDMSALKARVENGRLKLDEPTDLPEGTVVPLEIA